MKKRISPLVVMLILSLFGIYFPQTSYAQEDSPNLLKKDLRHKYQEAPDDEYVPVSRETQATSPAYKISGPGFFSIQVNVNSNGENIVGDAANEPSIAISPVDPSKIVIGWRQFDDVNNNFRQAGFSYTIDGGQSWTFPGVIEPGVFRSDPVLDFDAEGNFYYNSLTVDGGQFQCDVFQSTGDGTWDGGTFAQGGDKQWMAIDKTAGLGSGHIYSNWSSSFSICQDGFFTRSVDGNQSYPDCINIPQNPFWGTVSVGPDGEVYVVGNNGGSLVMARSSNAWDSSESMIWDYSTNVDLDGFPVAFADSPNPSGLLGQVWVATDHSGGESHGNVYMLCSVGRSSVNDPLDVMFSRSTNNGLDWSEPIRINDDAGLSAWQWFGTMSVAPDGRLDVVWLDTRDDQEGFQSALYHSYSMDAGLNWSVNEALSDSFDPHVGWPQQNKMGDYFDMVSDESGVHLAWAATFNGEQDVYYGYIPFSVVGTEEESASNFTLDQNYPNPFNTSTTIRYTLEEKDQVQLKVYNQLGEVVKVLVNEEKAAGEYTIEWDGINPKGGNISNGIYYLEMTTRAGTTKSKKMVLMK